MMLVQLPACKVGVQFHHHPYKKPLLVRERSRRFLNGITTCDIVIFYTDDKGNEASHPCARGFAVCKCPDVYTKALGRKFSLTSALRTPKGLTNKELLFDRTERDIIWKTYWEWLYRHAAPEARPPLEAAIIVSRIPPDPIHVAGEQLEHNASMLP